MTIPTGTPGTKIRCGDKVEISIQEFGRNAAVTNAVFDPMPELARKAAQSQRLV